MKSSEFITESISDIPPDVISRLGKLLIKPLRDRLAYAAAYPSFYILLDVFDEIVSNRTYAKSPRRNRAIELLFPYVVQNLDEIIKATKAEGYEYPFPRILKLFDQNIDNDAVAEVVEHNKDRLLAILTALIARTLKSKHNVGRSAAESIILKIIRTLRNNFIDWPELDTLFKQFISQKYNDILDQEGGAYPRTTMDYIIADMNRENITLNDLDPALVKRMDGLKLYTLNNYFLNFKWDPISYSIKLIKDWYKRLKKAGFTWPELTSFETMTYTQQLNMLKTPIVKDLLQLFKHKELDTVKKVLAELNKAGIEWPELSLMTTSLGPDTPVIESDKSHELVSRMSKAVSTKFSKGDYADALRYMGDYGFTYADAPKELQELINSRRMQIIKDLIDIARHNPDAWRVYRLMSFVKLVELGWPEIDTLFDSAKAASEDERI
jgi:hypothetical protein